MHFWTLVLKGVYLFSPQGQRVAIFEETISLSFALHLSENNFLFSHYYNSLLSSLQDKWNEREDEEMREFYCSPEAVFVLFNSWNSYKHITHKQSRHGRGKVATAH